MLVVIYIADLMAGMETGSEAGRAQWTIYLRGRHHCIIKKDNADQWGFMGHIITCNMKSCSIRELVKVDKIYFTSCLIPLR